MNNGSSKHIVKVAADLGHYIGDAHVPLHTTYNYNGQFSGQTGIHSLWETHVYELTIDQRISRRLEVEDIEVWSMQIINESHSLVEEVLLKEEAVRLIKGAPQHWGYRTRGRTLELIPTKEFALEHTDSLDGMVQLRFQKSAMAIASAWYSAWIDAGSPYLN